MTTSVRDTFDEDRRLVILRLLREAGRSNDSILVDAVYSFGHVVDRHQIRDDLRWLAQRQAIRITELMDGDVLVADLVEAGELHLDGRMRIDGVKRMRR